jgi:hypothetical protein
MYCDRIPGILCHSDHAVKGAFKVAVAGEASGETYVNQTCDGRAEQALRAFDAALQNIAIGAIPMVRRNIRAK